MDFLNVVFAYIFLFAFLGFIVYIWQKGIEK